MATIFAMSSGQPPAAIAVIRVSGPDAFAAARSLAGNLPEARRAGVRKLVDPTSGVLLDEALVICFPRPTSATGENLCELHVHGGRAVVAAVLGALSGLPGLRPAEPGEFTRRALTHGRIDLSEAEGLGDLLLAETESQRRAALSVAGGAISRAVEGWSSQLLDLSARVEAMLDFSDEDDVADVPLESIRADVALLCSDIEAILDAPPVERLRDGVVVVLAGPPNSGKSTLLNAMVDRDVAIVSPIAGTTRDRIEASVVRDGIAYRFTDTAGLALATKDPVEVIGVSLAIEAMSSADIVLWFGDEPLHDDRAIWLWPRADVRGELTDARRIAVAAPIAQGLLELWELVARRASAMLPREDQLVLNERQRKLCRQCAECLVAAERQNDLLIIADLLRQARNALNGITGASDVEAMLDSLFGKFCIGK